MVLLRWLRAPRMADSSAFIDESRQLDVTASGAQNVELNWTDRLAVGKLESSMTTLGGGKLRIAVNVTSQAVILELPARAVAPGRGDLVDGRPMTGGRRAVRAITKRTGWVHCHGRFPVMGSRVGLHRRPRTGQSGGRRQEHVRPSSSTR